MNPFANSISATIVAATVATFAGSAGATPLSGGSLPLKDAAAPAFETVQWRGGWGWGGWRGGWGGWRGGWGWGGVGLGLATGAIIGGAVAATPYYSDYSYSYPYYSSYSYPYYSSYSYPYYGSYSYPSYAYYNPVYYGGYGYWPYQSYGYGLIDHSPSRRGIGSGNGNRRGSVRHY